MFKRFIMVFFSGLFLVTAFAQEQREMTVSGNVQDADLKEPMVQATVQLFRSKDSTFVGGTVTDLRGTFSVEAPANGIYRLKVSSVGYQAIEREVTLRRNQSQDVGTLLMLFCYLTVRRAVQPLKQLDEQAKRIAEGHFDEPLPESPRRDSVGRLQNSFISMQRSLAQTVSDIRGVNAELEQHNDELTRAYQLKLETNRQKAAFIQDMYHEIRTPLNIISGFAQVLTTSLHGLPTEEVADITARMSESATDITRLTHELGEAANSHD